MHTHTHQYSVYYLYILCTRFCCCRKERQLNEYMNKAKRHSVSSGFPLDHLPIDAHSSDSEPDDHAHTPRSHAPPKGPIPKLDKSVSFDSPRNGKKKQFRRKRRVSEKTTPSESTGRSTNETGMELL